MVGTILQEINNHPHHDVRKTKYDEHEKIFSKETDALFSSLWEKFKVFWTPKRSGYLMEPIGVKDDLRIGVRNVHIANKVLSHFLLTR